MDIKHTVIVKQLFRGCLYGGEPARVPKLARLGELISSCVYMRFSRRAGSPKQTTGLIAINSNNFLKT
jgi:hypothetical protein